MTGTFRCPDLAALRIDESTASPPRRLAHHRRRRSARGESGRERHLERPGAGDRRRRIDTAGMGGSQAHAT